MCLMKLTVIDNNTKSCHNLEFSLSGGMTQPSATNTFGTQAGSTLGGLTAGIGQISTPNPFAPSSTSGLFAPKATFVGAAVPATMAFGTISTSGATTTSSPFGTSASTPIFGQSTSAPTFSMGTTSSIFGQTSTPLFGSSTFRSSTPAFNTSMFSSSTPGFSSTPAFGTASPVPQLFILDHQWLCDTLLWAHTLYCVTFKVLLVEFSLQSHRYYWKHSISRCWWSVFNSCKLSGVWRNLSTYFWRSICTGFWVQLIQQQYVRIHFCTGKSNRLNPVLGMSQPLIANPICS